MSHFLRFSQTKRQDGMVLIIALIFLLLITVIGLSSMRSSNLNTLMSANEQFRVEAGQRVEALIDQVLATDNNLLVTGEVGDVLCDQADTSAECRQSNMSVSPQVLAVNPGEVVTYRAVRKGPETAPAPPLNDELASSAASYSVAFFEVQASYDGRDARLGKASAAQGVMVLVPNQQ